MKHYLINPELKWCKANLHCHSTVSDGELTPEHLKELYKSRGYSVVAFTDHDQFVEHSNLTDDEFVALTSSECGIVEDIHNIRWPEMKCVHLNFFSPNPHIEMTSEDITNAFQSKDLDKSKYPCDGNGRVYTKENIQRLIDWANEIGCLVQFNHPNWSLNTREDYINLRGLWSLEIFNYATELCTGAEYCPNIYDDMLRSGHRIKCTYGDDNHNHAFETEGSFGGFVYIGVEKLTYENVFNSLKKGTFYSSMDPVIKSLVYDDETREVTIECSPVIRIVLVGNNRRFDGKNGENITKHTFILDEHFKSFRIGLVDKFGKHADTNAYFLDELK